jgi:hypothetical protein
MACGRGRRTDEKAEHPRDSAEPKGKTNVWPREGNRSEAEQCRNAEPVPLGAGREDRRRQPEGRDERERTSQKLKDQNKKTGGIPADGGPRWSSQKNFHGARKARSARR